MKQITEISLSHKIIIFSLIAVVIMFGLFFLAFLPTIRAVSKSYTDFLAQKQSTENLLNAGATADVIQKQTDGLKQSIAHFNDSFLSSGREIDFIQFLEATGRENGIKQTIQLNDPAFAKPDDFYPSALLVIKINGSFLQFLNYLIDLEHSPYYINVFSVTINSTTPGSIHSSEQSPLIQKPFTILSVPDEGGFSMFLNGNEPIKQSVSEINATVVGKIFWKHE